MKLLQKIKGYVHNKSDGLVFYWDDWNIYSPITTAKMNWVIYREKPTIKNNPLDDNGLPVREIVIMVYEKFKEQVEEDE